MKPSKILRVTVTAIAAMCFVMAHLATSAAQDLKKLRVLYVPSFAGHLTVMVAKDAGIFQRNGLDVELISTFDAVRPLASGDGDVGLPPAGTVQLAALQGVNLKIVAAIQSRITSAIMMRPDTLAAIPAGERSYPAIIKTLVGKKIGVGARGTSTDLTTRYMLLEAGLTPDKDVFVLPFAPGAPQMAALREKQVDAVTVFSPFSMIMQLDGSAVSVVNLAKGEGPPALVQPFSVATVLDRFLEQKPEEVDRFVRSMKDVIEYIRAPANRSAVKEIVAKRFQGVAPAVVDGMLDELIATFIDTRITRADIDRLNEVQRKLGVIPKDVTPEQILAPALLK